MTDVFVHGGDWREITRIEVESVSIVQEYNMNSLFVIVYVPAMLIMLYFISCVLDEYYRQKPLKTY